MYDILFGIMYLGKNMFYFIGILIIDIRTISW